MKGRSKSSSNVKSDDKYLSFNNAVKNDILEALKYAKNEIELKDILSQVLNYETISTSCPIRTDGARLEFATEILKIPGLNRYPKLVCSVD